MNLMNMLIPGMAAGGPYGNPNAGPTPSSRGWGGMSQAQDVNNPWMKRMMDGQGGQPNMGPAGGGVATPPQYPQRPINPGITPSTTSPYGQFGQRAPQAQLFDPNAQDINPTQPAYPSYQPTPPPYSRNTPSAASVHSFWANRGNQQPQTVPFGGQSAPTQQPNPSSGGPTPFSGWGGPNSNGPAPNPWGNQQPNPRNYGAYGRRGF
jgi:hypothetical protein